MSAAGKAPASEEELINLLNRNKEYVARLNVWKYMQNVYSNFVPAFGTYIGKMFKEFPRCLKTDSAKEKIAYFIKNILEGGYMLLPIAVPAGVVAYGEGYAAASTANVTINGVPTILVELYLGYFGYYPPHEMVGVFVHELLHHATKSGVLSHSGMVDILAESGCLYLQALATDEERRHWVNEEEARRLREAFTNADRRFGDRIWRIESEVKELFLQVTGLTDDEASQKSNYAGLLQFTKEVEIKMSFLVSSTPLSKYIYWASQNGVGNISISVADYLGLTREDLARLKQFASEWAKV